MFLVVLLLGALVSAGSVFDFSVFCFSFESDFVLSFPCPFFSVAPRGLGFSLAPLELEFSLAPLGLDLALVELEILLTLVELDEFVFFWGLCWLLLVSASRVESWSDSSDPGLLPSELSLLLPTWLDVPSISDSSNREFVWSRLENSPGSFRLIIVASLTELSCDVCPGSDGCFFRVSFMVMSSSVVSISTTGSSVCGCGLLLLPLLITCQNLQFWQVCSFDGLFVCLFVCLFVPRYRSQF